ncbi:hypothetical protein [Kiloniella antarctica]|uniref:Lipoprotein n=1 Tax=Kiloniella antarctica TaxID=1550907 RepID=A0ABW5BJ13_9PROT
MFVRIVVLALTWAVVSCTPTDILLSLVSLIAPKPRQRPSRVQKFHLH